MATTTTTRVVLRKAGLTQTVLTTATEVNNIITYALGQNYEVWKEVEVYDKKAGSTKKVVTEVKA